MDIRVENSYQLIPSRYSNRALNLCAEMSIKNLENFFVSANYYTRPSFVKYKISPLTRSSSISKFWCSTSCILRSLYLQSSSTAMVLTRLDKIIH